MPAPRSLFQNFPPYGEQLDLLDEPGSDVSVEFARQIVAESSELFIKKLALNDWQWSVNRNAHQAGVYIPKKERDSGFFPSLKPTPGRQEKAEILTAEMMIGWLKCPEHAKPGQLRNYTSKGAETHLTNVPKSEFEKLAPASLLLIGKLRNPSKEVCYLAMTIDSRSIEFDYVAALFSLEPDFVSGTFDTQEVHAAAPKGLDAFLREALQAFQSGRFVEFMTTHGAMPPPAELAIMARQRYMQAQGLRIFDPFSMPSPGDAVRTISRGIEFDLYKEYEVRIRSLQLIQLILGRSEEEGSVARALANIITNFREIDGVLLSAAQQRKARAGASFELHIEALLVGAKVPHERQVVLSGKKRPDFVLPSLLLYQEEKRDRSDALVLSAKTTLRERWKQVVGEINNCDLYLATVDENIATNAIQEMSAQQIYVVVPESLKKSKMTVYEDEPTVITFSDFFKEHLKSRRFPAWQRLNYLA